VSKDLDVRRALFVYDVARLEAMVSYRPVVPEAWDGRSVLFRNQFIDTIARLCADDAPPTTPEAEHESWVRAYEKMGWRYGPVRDPAAKTHPDLVPYADLPEAEREKDEVFLALCEFARKYIRKEGA
jgi:hypothetical protein